MKKLLCHTLILLLLMQANMRYLLRAAYIVNKKYVAQNLCENRKRGDFNCAGKCFLYKQTKKAEKGQQQEREKGKEVSEMYGTRQTLLPEIAISLLTQIHCDGFRKMNADLPSFDIFRPPCKSVVPNVS